MFGDASFHDGFESSFFVNTNRLCLSMLYVQWSSILLDSRCHIHSLECERSIDSRDPRTCREGRCREGRYILLKRKDSYWPGIDTISSLTTLVATRGALARPVDKDL